MSNEAVPVVCFDSNHITAFLQGWLDITYTSPDGNFRLSRGNKGTLFILVREEKFKASLEAAIRANDDSKVRGRVRGGVPFPFMQSLP